MQRSFRQCYVIAPPLHILLRLLHNVIYMLRVSEYIQFSRTLFHVIVPAPSKFLSTLWIVNDDIDPSVKRRSTCLPTEAKDVLKVNLTSPPLSPMMAGLPHSLPDAWTINNFLWTITSSQILCITAHLRLFDSR